jgi:hypothetical protein
MPQANMQTASTPCPRHAASAGAQAQVGGPENANRTDNPALHNMSYNIPTRVTHRAGTERCRQAPDAEYTSRSAQVDEGRPQTSDSARYSTPRGARSGQNMPAPNATYTSKSVRISSPDPQARDQESNDPSQYLSRPPDQDRVDSLYARYPPKQEYRSPARPQPHAELDEPVCGDSRGRQRWPDSYRDLGSNRPQPRTNLYDPVHVGDNDRQTLPRRYAVDPLRDPYCENSFRAQPPRRASSPSREGVPRYTGKFEFAHFKVQFECIADDHGWSYVEMGKRLNRCLVDEARAVLGTLHGDDTTDYRALCKALDSLHSTPGGKALVQAQLQRILRPAGQCAAAFGREIKRLGKKAYPNGNDEALIASFIRGLNDEDLRKYVQLKMPPTLDDAIEHACIYQTVEGEGDVTVAKKPKLVTAVSAKPEEGPSKAPWENRIGALEKKLDEMLKRLDTPGAKPPQARQDSQGTRPPLSNIQCYDCRQWGHYANVCPQRRERGARVVTSMPAEVPHAPMHSAPSAQMPFVPATSMPFVPAASMPSAPAFPETFNSLNN